MDIEEKEKKFQRAKRLGQIIYSARNNLKMSREVLAEKCNISTNYLYEIETGKKVPNVIIFATICDNLQISMDEILNSPSINNFNEFMADVAKDFSKLSHKEKMLIKNNIHFLARESNE